jgi:hypothetical protein
LAIPILKTKNAFDSLIEQQFVFTYNGSQVFKNRLVIYKNSDNSQVYDNTETTFQLYHTLSASVLTNGVQYNAKLSVFDKDGNESGFSNSIVFTCHKTPILSVDIEQNQIVKNSYLPINLTYTSEDGELLNYWNLILYNSGNVQISQTDQILATQSMGTTINSLENNTAYSFEIIGTTVDGMIISTGKINFSVVYIEPTTFNKVILTNNSDDGTVGVESHLISVDGQTNMNPITYIDNIEMDLTQGNKVWFDNGFQISNNFTKQLIIRNPLPYQIIYYATNGTEQLSLKYMLGDFEDGEKAYFLLEIINPILTTRIASDIFNKLDYSEAVYVDIRNKDGLWGIQVNNYSVSVEEWNNYNLTVEEWNNKNINIEDFRLKGKLLLT